MVYHLSACDAGEVYVWGKLMGTPPSSSPSSSSPQLPPDQRFPRRVFTRANSSYDGDSPYANANASTMQLPLTDIVEIASSAYHMTMKDTLGRLYMMGVRGPGQQELWEEQQKHQQQQQQIAMLAMRRNQTPHDDGGGGVDGGDGDVVGTGSTGSIDSTGIGIGSRAAMVSGMAELVLPTATATATAAGGDSDGDGDGDGDPWQDTPMRLRLLQHRAGAGLGAGDYTLVPGFEDRLFSFEVKLQLQLPLPPVCIHR